MWRFCSCEQVLVGGRVLSDRPGNFVEPTIVSITHDAPCVKVRFVLHGAVVQTSDINFAYEYSENCSRQFCTS